jgi:hypothetical protein
LSRACLGKLIVLIEQYKNGAKKAGFRTARSAATASLLAIAAAGEDTPICDGTTTPILRPRKLPACRPESAAPRQSTFAGGMLQAPDGMLPLSRRSPLQKSHSFFNIHSLRASQACLGK